MTDMPDMSHCVTYAYYDSICRRRCNAVVTSPIASPMGGAAYEAANRQTDGIMSRAPAVGRKRITRRRRVPLLIVLKCNKQSSEPARHKYIERILPP